MKLTGLHLLLTYECNYECDHCFVWSGPRQTGTMTIRQVEEILRQAMDLGTIEWIYFEGGEPFLYYAVMLSGVQRAAALGFQVGIVSNGYWATGVEDAIAWLTPLTGLVQDLSMSSDTYHGGDEPADHVRHARVAADQLDIPLGVITVAGPGTSDAAASMGKLPQGQSAVMYRGRAVKQLAPRAAGQPWDQFTACPHEDLREPGRVHVDPLGHVHICQGISLGNLFEMPLREICRRYDPDTHPVTGPLLAGGPAELARRHSISHAERYADACHLCDETRRALRPRYPQILAPDQMYGPVCGQ
jgi:hypothetical protein